MSAPSLSAAILWARDANAGDYLVTYADSGLTNDEDPGSRCGYDDSDLAGIDRVLADSDLRLVANDRGLIAEARR